MPIPSLRYCEHGERNSNKIFLTFDDGPNPCFTTEILDILAFYNVKASFFAIGKRCAEYPELANKILRRGHLLGNHTYSHNNGDFYKADKIIKHTTSVKDVVFVRPPFYDLSYCINEADFLKDKIIVLGDVDSRDYLDISETEVIRNVLENINNGSIIDFHDGSEKEEELKKRPLKLLKALPILIEKLKKNYIFACVDDIKSTIKKIDLKQIQNRH